MDKRNLTREEAIEKALLYTFQLSGKDYRKMQTALSEVGFIRALEQDGYTVAAIPPDPRLDSAVHWGFIDSETGDFIEVGDAGMQRRWCPPDPRLDALLAAMEEATTWPSSGTLQHAQARWRDALAAFEDKATVEVVPFCECTNEELEQGKSCSHPDCPNKP